MPRPFCLRPQVALHEREAALADLEESRGDSAAREAAAAVREQAAAAREREAAEAEERRVAQIEEMRDQSVRCSPAAPSLPASFLVLRLLPLKRARACSGVPALPSRLSAEAQLPVLF